jgi:hypothetical protein
MAGCFACAKASVVTARDAVATEEDPNDVTESNLPSSWRQVGSMLPAGGMADQIVITEKFSQAISSSTEMQKSRPLV